MLEHLHKELQAKVDALSALQSASEAKKTWTADDQKAHDALVSDAQAIKKQIENAQAADAIKQWAGQSAGSAVKSGFGAEQRGENSYGAWSGPAITPNDGVIPGVSRKAVKAWTDAQGRLQVEGGELEAMDARGQAKLDALKSGEYKDDLVRYLRTGRKDMKILQEGLDSAGGAWVTPDFQTRVIQKMATVSSVYQDVFKFNTGSNMVSFPQSVYSTDDKYTTGVRFSWTAEAPAANYTEATNPVAGRINIPIYTATCELIVTREQLEDTSFDLLGFSSDKMGEAFALGIDDAIINADGIGKIQGILSHPNADVIYSTAGGMKVLSGASGAVAWGTATTGLVGVDALSPPQYEPGLKWYANKGTYAAIRMINAGTATLPQWSLGDAWPNYGNGYQPMLLGYPVRRDQFMPDISTTTKPIMLADLQGYYLPQRTGITIEVLREVEARRGLVVILGRQRLGGQLVESWRVKLLKSHSS